jgi:hypothetical protein
MTYTIKPLVWTDQPEMKRMVANGFKETYVYNFDQKLLWIQDTNQSFECSYVATAVRKANQLHRESFSQWLEPINTNDGRLTESQLISDW